MSTMTTVSLLALSNVLSFAFANPVVPAAPVITPRAVLPRRLLARQTDSGSDSGTGSASTSDNPYYSWIGYYQDPDATSSYTWMYCPGTETFTTSVYSSTTLVGCCDPDQCTTDLALTCSDSSAYYLDSTSGTSGYSCTSSCNADTIYLSSTANPTEAMLWWGCNDVPPKFYFQQEPANAVVIVSSAVSESSSSSSGSSSQASSTSSAPTQTGSSAAATTPVPEKKSSSKAWIAGVVVGVVALFAIAGLAFWLIRNRKKNKDTEYKPAPQGVAQVYPAVPPQGYSPGYAGDQQQQGYVPEQQQPTAYQHQDAKGFFSPQPGMQSPPTQYQDPHTSAYYGQNGAPAQVHPHYGEAPSEMPGSSPSGPSTNAPAELPEAAPKPEPQTKTN
ncbi:hypothetical protein K491DRAFT_712852 [Lophiostoma macrostomum CBS 122681]|uniref:Mid2 domain-containing protein n=1 Tax=Lophiostoma macrostomum CBS 122681 TaxID=1314788 RepID=A0A6A6TK43_9PLEO|nr:hypothetical protein K491DRAFT_712852 [Lophiostoma macrostomum CBS 122681]